MERKNFSDGDKINKGDHICFFYKDYTEWENVIIPFALHGIEKKEKVVIINNEPLNESLLQVKINDEIKLNDLKCVKDQISIFNTSDIYGADAANPYILADNIRNYSKLAKEQGFSGIRIAGDGTDMLSENKNLNSFLKYELIVNHEFKEKYITAICSYDQNKILGNAVADLIFSHPSIIIGDVLCRNILGGIIKFKENGQPDINKYLNDFRNAELERRETLDEYVKLKIAEKKNAELLNEIFQGHNSVNKNNISIIEKNIISSILPLARKLSDVLTGDKKKMIDLIINKITNISDPYGIKLDSLKGKLTPTEIHICSLLREKMSSKKIAEILNISSVTVDRHKNNIRAKLGIKGRKNRLLDHLNK